MNRIASMVVRVAGSVAGSVAGGGKPTLVLSGPFRPYRDDGTSTEIERDVKVESEALRRALSGPSGLSVDDDDMDGFHVFTVVCEMSFDGGDPGSSSTPPLRGGFTVESHKVVAVDGMELLGKEDAEAAKDALSLTASEIEDLEKEYESNYEESFDDADDYGR